MKYCNSCGGELISVGNNYRYCAYCGNAYGEDDIAQTQRIDSKGIKQLDIGVGVFENYQLARNNSHSYFGIFA